LKLFDRNVIRNPHLRYYGLDPILSIVVDSNPTDVKDLAEFLKKYAGSEIKEPIIKTSYEETLKYLTRAKHDISFLGINQGNRTICFDVLRQIKRQHLGIIVFYADSDSIPNIFETEQLDSYLLLVKPVTEEKIIALKAKIAEEFKRLQTIEYNFLRLHQVWFKSTEGAIQVRQRDIVYIEVTGDSIRVFYLENDMPKPSFLCSGSLNKTQKRLYSRLFIRVSRQYLVNRYFIKRQVKTVLYLNDGTKTIELHDIPKNVMKKYAIF